MEKSKIEWCDDTWNPVTGCFHDCPYCYAKIMAHRYGMAFAPRIDEIDGCKYDSFQGMDTMLELNTPYKKDGVRQPYPMAFLPTFHRYRLNDYVKKSGRVTFVCSMADLFGEWVPDSWIKEVFAACEAAPQHTYLFLTKNPSRYAELFSKKIFVDKPNFWYGSTQTGEIHCAYVQPKAGKGGYNTFFSMEPLLSPTFGDGSSAFENHALSHTQWVIIGAETGNRKDKTIPKKEWISDIVAVAREYGIPVFMKESLVPIMGEENMRREFPESILSMARLAE